LLNCVRRQYMVRAFQSSATKPIARFLRDHDADTDSTTSAHRSATRIMGPRRVSTTTTLRAVFLNWFVRLHRRSEPTRLTQGFRQGYQPFGAGQRHFQIPVPVDAVPQLLAKERKRAGEAGAGPTTSGERLGLRRSHSSSYFTHAHWVAQLAAGEARLRTNDARLASDKTAAVTDKYNAGMR